MPPKRKRAEDSASDPVPSGSNVPSGLDVDVPGLPPAPKRTRRTSSKVASSKSRGKSLDESQEPSPYEGRASRSNGNAGTSAKPRSAKAGGPEPYNMANARRLFRTYQDPDAPGEIGPEGFEKLCNDLNISLEGALPLVLAWQLHGLEMGRLKENEWMRGTEELRVSNVQALALAIRDLGDLLLSQKPPIEPPSGSTTPAKKGVEACASGEPYDRRKYYEYAADRDKAFSELYVFCFNLAKPPASRNIDMDTASAFWSVLVAPRYPIMHDFLKFISDKGTYKGVNKDLWNMTLEFCRSVRPDLSDYEADGAWPTMLDDFVAWKKSTQSQTKQDVEVV